MLKMQSVIFVFTLALMFGTFTTVLALDAGDLSRYVGYYILETTNVSGDFEGADYDKPVKLDNGMIFEFQDYSYSYSYWPEVIILVKVWPEHICDSLVRQGFAKWECASYALIIEDEVYDVTRVK